MAKKRKSTKIYDENWELCHQVVEVRDGGRRCAISGCGVEENLDLDHCFSRDIKELFFETSNLTYLCKRHHQRKSMAKGGAVDHEVDEIVRRRVGEEKWKELLERSYKSCPGFWSVMFQERYNTRLKEELAMMMSEREGDF